eukprot:TRINITY_DN10176_c0_g1_i3.p1 TRINITY_DN10176_c0_g1~~TRINITY_DN10176_c0_g1_i3.p1  ORF type:complete len:1918 (+),score=217.84 TRINITY_DN10176_c0_g1_i3:374-5755(+)
MSSTATTQSATSSTATSRTMTSSTSSSNTKSSSSITMSSTSTSSSTASSTSSTSSSSTTSTTMSCTRNCTTKTTTSSTTSNFTTLTRTFTVTSSTFSSISVTSSTSATATTVSNTTISLTYTSITSTASTRTISSTSNTSLTSTVSSSLTAAQTTSHVTSTLTTSLTSTSTTWPLSTTFTLTNISSTTSTSNHATLTEWTSYTTTIANSTAQTMPTTTLASTTIAPAPCGVEQCSANGYAYRYQGTCMCSCPWPYGGSDCRSCSDSTYSWLNGTCIRCLPNMHHRTTVALSASTLPLQIKLAFSGCMEEPEIKFTKSSVRRRAYAYSMLSDDGIVNIPMPSCSSSSNSYYTDAVNVYVQGSYWQTVLCAPMLTCQHVVSSGSSSPQGRAHVHFSSAASWTSVRAALGLIRALRTGLPSVLRPAKLILTSGAGTPARLEVEIESSAEAADSALNEWVRHLLHTSSLAASCESLGSLPMFENISALVIVNDNSFDCPEFYGSLLASVANGTRLAIIGSNIAPPAFVSPLVVTGPDLSSTLYPFMCEWLVALSTRPETSKNCLEGNQPVTFLPTRVYGMQRHTIFLSGACDVKQCCVLGTDFGRCSSMIGAEAGKPTCHLPMIDQVGTFRLAVQTSDGMWRNAEGTLEIKLGVYSIGGWRSRRWFWERSSNPWPFSYQGDVVLYRRASYWMPERSVKDFCYRWVAIGTENFEVMAPLTDTVCLSMRWSTTVTVPTFKSRALQGCKPFPQVPRMVAVQSFNKPMLAEVPDGPGAIFAPDDLQDSTPAPDLQPQPINSDLQTQTGTADYGSCPNTKASSWTTRVDTYISHALANAGTRSSGRSQRAVRKALQAAGLKSLLQGERKDCAASDTPDRLGSCTWAWAAAAKDAGRYLVSAGFEEVATDRTLQNAERGDIAIWPDLPSTELGHIAIKLSDDPARTWVSDFVHSSIFSGTAAVPALYRLREDVQMALEVGEEIIPLPVLADLVNASDLLPAWARSTAAASAAAYRTVAERYRCPASWARGMQPRQLRWSGRYGNARLCRRLYPQRNTPYGVRCCYDSSNLYIPSWPSRLVVGGPPITSWSEIEEDEVERLACGAEGGASSECMSYATQRPAVPSTNNPFGQNSLWRPRRPWGGGWGDPHCSTYDGAKFECNFVGEALWTKCGNWTVHVIAQPIGDGQATVITKLAVTSETDTVIGRIANGSDGNANYELFLNNEEAQSGDAGSYLSISADPNGTITIEDSNGNSVTASFQSSLIALSTSPGDGCFNRTKGLCGNNNDDPTDDLVTSNGTQLSLNASGDVIYQEFVRTHLIAELQDSLFPADDFVAGNLGFVPKFITSAEIEGCPAECERDLACCFDSSVGGEQFAKMYVENKAQLEKSNAESISFTENMPPYFELAPGLITIDPAKTAFRIMATIVAADATENVSNLTCDVCPTVNSTLSQEHNVSCAVSGTGSRAVLLVNSTSLPSGYFRCSATDSQGATATSATKVVLSNASYWQEPLSLAEMPGASSPTQNVTFAGDYAIVIGSAKTRFLEECTAALSNVACIDVFAGSIVVTLQGSTNALTIATAQLQIFGLDLPSFAPLNPPSSETTTTTPTEAPSTSTTTAVATTVMSNVSNVTTTVLEASASSNENFWSFENKLFMYSVVACGSGLAVCVFIMSCCCIPIIRRRMRKTSGQAKQNPETGELPKLGEVLAEKQNPEEILEPRATFVVFDMEQPDVFVIPDFDTGHDDELLELRDRFTHRLVSQTLPSGPFYQVSPEPPLTDVPNFPTSPSDAGTGDTHLSGDSKSSL